MCVKIDDYAPPSEEVAAVLALAQGDCASLRENLRYPGHKAGCTGGWRMRVEKNVSVVAAQAAWGPMARYMRVDLPGSGEVVEDFVVRLADLARLPGALVCVVRW